MAATRNKNTWQTVRNAVEGYLYLAPTLIILGVFVFYPIIGSFRLSLTRVAPFGNATRYVGAENYQRLLTQIIEGGDYWNSLKVTFFFTLGTVPVGIFIAVVLLGDKRLKLHRTQVVATEGQEGAPGEVLLADQGRIEVACGEGTLALLELQLEGKKRMEAAQFLAGRSLSAGDHIDSLPRPKREE